MGNDRRLLRWMLRHEQPAALDLDHPAQVDIAWAADRIADLEAEVAWAQDVAHIHDHYSDASDKAYRTAMTQAASESAEAMRVLDGGVNNVRA